MFGIKYFNSQKFTGKNYIPGENYLGLATLIKRLPGQEVNTVDYIFLG